MVGPKDKSQPPKSGAMIQTREEVLMNTSVVQSQPPKSGAMIQTSGRTPEMLLLKQVSTP